MSGQNQPVSNQQYPPQVLSSFQTNDEIDLKELFRVLWGGKFIISVTTVLFVIVSFGYVFNKPNLYQANAKYIVDITFYSNYGVFAPRVTQEYLSSEGFKEAIVRHSNTKKSLLDGVIVTYDKGNNTISVSQLSLNPRTAFEGVDIVGSSINDIIKKQELVKANLALDSLLRSSTEVSTSYKAQEYIDELLAKQIFKKALLENSESKLVQVISAPTIPTSPVKPNRALVIVVGALLGGMLGAVIVLVSFAFRREEDK